MIFCRLDEQGCLTVDDSGLVFSYGDSRRRPYTIGSCNGLLFSCGEHNDHGQFKTGYAVDNPATKQVAMLPTLPILEANYCSLRPAGLGFALDQYSLPSLGMSRWKLVAVLQKSFDFRSKKSLGLKVSIFDSAKGVWTTTPAGFTDDSDLAAFSSIPGGTFRLGASSVHIKGALHWVWMHWLVVLYLKTRTFRIIKLPDAEQEYGVLWESDAGRLNYTNVCHRRGLRIWVLETKEKSTTAAAADYSWRRIYSVPIDILKSKLRAAGFKDYDKTISLYAVNEELQLIHLNVNCTLACFEIAEKTITLVNIPPDCKVDPVVQLANQFIGWKFNQALRLPKLPELGTLVKKRRLREQSNSKRKRQS